jgi:murein DD-endopeptidase MepM/ murein hydrolase activator NlpD
MGEIIHRRRGLAAAASLSAIAALLAACVQGPMTPAPVYLRGAAPMAADGPPPSPWRENKTVIVRRGQSVSDIAHANHVPEGALIAANNLNPPYRLRVGARLIIPDRNVPPVRQAALRPVPAPTKIMTASPPPRPIPPPQMAANVPPPAQNPPMPRPTMPNQGAVVPTDPPAPPPSAARVLPDIVPLDSAPKPVAAAAPPPPAGASGEPPPPFVNEPAGGRFPWPVHGRILAGYGAATGGARNEGINIAAPLGTPVRAIDSGTVAYAGNEVKGYGNLVLIKHANGWISAYAHLADVTVRKGDAVGAGQIIAKVGDSGGVGAPQLHFELRRGQKPVDPKEFLQPAGSAAAKAEQKAS